MTEAKLRDHVAATAALAKITGLRWCSNHGGEAPEAGGTWTESRGSKRFICATCTAERRARK